jgi:hypothetical protein
MLLSVLDDAAFGALLRTKTLLAMGSADAPAVTREKPGVMSCEKIFEHKYLSVCPERGEVLTIIESPNRTIPSE